MTVVFRHHEKLEVNRVEYYGSISFAELRALADFQATNPSLLTYDCLTVVTATADFRAIDLATLDDLFAKYRALFQPLSFLILRRSAWLNFSPSAQAHVDYWVRGRDAKGGMSSDVRQFDSYEAAGEWLVLNPRDLATLKLGEGFKELARYTIPPEPALAR